MIMQVPHSFTYRLLFYYLCNFILFLDLSMSRMTFLLINFSIFALLTFTGFVTALVTDKTFAVFLLALAPLAIAS